MGPDEGGTPAKQSRNEAKKEELKTATSTSSDHLVALTQLREQIANLQRQLSQKDKDLLAKDRQVPHYCNLNNIGIGYFGTRTRF
jgi:Tfp pilus assembly protein PilO